MKWQLVFGTFLFQYRSFTPLPVMLAVLLVFPPSYPGASLALALVGLATAAVGEALRVHAVGHAFHGTSGRESYLRADDLNRGGLYSLVRNPLYWGNWLIFGGLLTVYGSWPALLAGIAFLVMQYHFIVRAEEHYLEEKYGEAYRSYCREVPRFRWRFHGWRPPQNPFSARKVVRKENDSVFNLLMSFLLIHAWRHHRLEGRVEAGTVYLAVGVALLLAYVLVKVWKHRGSESGRER